jgi:creatinine amidohydrolase/Fe(II)-dependent formamide hydrolase-like protein
MLAIRPDLVQMEKALPNSNSLNKQKAVYSALTNHPGSFPAITGNGVWGDPRKASEQTGRMLLANAVDGLTSAINELKKFRTG